METTPTSFVSLKVCGGVGAEGIPDYESTHEIDKNFPVHNLTYMTDKKVKAIFYYIFVIL